MTPITILVELERPAKKSGGDRYKGTAPDRQDFVIYLPQSISRAGALYGLRTNPYKTLSITFEEGE